MDGFLNQGWELILPGCGGTSALGRGAILGALWPHEPQPASESAITQLGWGFHILRGGIDPGDLRFRPRVVGFVEIYTSWASLKLARAVDWLFPAQYYEF